MTKMIDGTASRHHGGIAFSDLSLESDGRTITSAQVSLINGGQDTQVLLRDGSTIVLKGMLRHVEADFIC
jgi:hypothetical protein